MIYHIMKVTIARHEEGNGEMAYSFLTSVFVPNLDDYRRSLREQYQCQRVALVYEEIEKTVK
jgi:hypothetical protein